MSTTRTDRWSAYWTTVGNEAYLMARVWLEASPALRNDAANWITGTDRDTDLDWTRWFTDVATTGRGWSSTEWRLFKLTRAVLWTWNHPDDPERSYDDPITYPSIDLADVLGGLGSWERPVLDALVSWASGGRLTVTEAGR